MIRSFLTGCMVLCTSFSLFASSSSSYSSDYFDSYSKHHQLLAFLESLTGNRNHGRGGIIPGPQGLPGPQGPQGLQGPPGPNAFVTDIGQSLIFTFSLDTVIGLLGTTTVTPFVEGPNGITYYATPRTYTFSPLVVGILPLASIIVPDPLFGNYQAGILTTNATGLADIDITLLTAATQSRDGTTTLLFPATLTAAVPLIGATRVQVSQNYSYYVSP